MILIFNLFPHIPLTFGSLMSFFFYCILLQFHHTTAHHLIQVLIATLLYLTKCVIFLSGYSLSIWYG